MQCTGRWLQIGMGSWRVCGRCARDCAALGVWKGMQVIGGNGSRELRLWLCSFWLGSLLWTYFVTAHLPACVIPLLAGCGEGRLLAVTASGTGRAAAAACSLLLAPFWLGSLLLTYFVTAHLPSCVIRLADGCAGCGEGRLFLLAWLCSSFLFFLFL